MLFNSQEFLLVFLPMTLAGFYLLRALGGGSSNLAWLTLASLFFYGWWNPSYIPLLVGSTAANFALGRLIDRREDRWRRHLLALGIAGNLALIAVYKYAGFFASNLNQVFGTDLPVSHAAIPLGISFFTFQQIVYLCDVHARKMPRHSYFDHLLVVSFFPHLIAGPIVHVKELLPQFTSPRQARATHARFSVGLTILMIGLFKKVVLADGIAVYADPVFTAAAAGQAVGMLTAWGGALAYTCQLYFDFSGYSDMAVGLAVLFGVRLPINFFSPYKTTSIIEFWRRWHISLSRFLRDYLYVPLGGSRRGPGRRYVNLLITMLLGGLWHGAGWTFVLWGGLHGLYLVVNHLWRSLRHRLGIDRPSRAGAFAGWLLTFLSVVVAWVLFRAESLDAARHMLAGMAGLNGVDLPANLAAWPAALLASDGLWQGTRQLFAVSTLLGVCWLAPNTYELTRRFRPALSHPLVREAHGIDVAPFALRWAIAYGFLFWGILFGLPSRNAFIYFNF